MNVKYPIEITKYPIEKKSVGIDQTDTQLKFPNTQLKKKQWVFTQLTQKLICSPESFYSPEGLMPTGSHVF